MISFILHAYSNIIDVAAMDSHNLEPHELNDRIKLYSHKLSQQWSTIPEDSSYITNRKANLDRLITFIILSKLFFRSSERYTEQRSRTITVIGANLRRRSLFGKQVTRWKQYNVIEVQRGPCKYARARDSREIKRESVNTIKFHFVVISHYHCPMNATGY